MKRLFADSFFFFAYLNPEDGAHEAAEKYFDGFDGRLVTTEWVLTEVADGMAGLGDRETFSAFHEALQSDPEVTVLPSSPELFAEGFALYSSRKDKEWSLTDCISFVVMDHERLVEALTGDHHFRQAGYTTLLEWPMARQDEQIPIQPVENPILCSPYKEPDQHWFYDTRTGIPSKTPGRRPASYWFKTERTGSAQMSLLAEEERGAIRRRGIMVQPIVLRESSAPPPCASGLLR